MTTSQSVTSPDRWSAAADTMIHRVRQSKEAELEGFPHYADQDTGTWTTTPNGFWTGGFFVGELWLAARLTDDPDFAREAGQWLSRLESRVDSGTVFRGFLFYYSCVTGAVLCGDATARAMAHRAARSLARTFNPVPGILPLGSEAEEAHRVGDNEANIDGISAVPLMLWAARDLGDADLRRVAIDHALGSARFFVNTDGSVIQSASFDPNTGEVTQRYTHKGFSDSSIWTRAQAWAMLGFSSGARLAPEEPRLLEIAERVSDWWLDHVPDDLIAYWDFSAPVTPETRRDTSGTAIAAAALLKLSMIHPDPERARRYREAARQTASQLVANHLRPSGILADGCFDPRSGTAVASELIWGDYFLLETLAFLSGRLAAEI